LSYFKATVWAIQAMYGRFLQAVRALEAEPAVICLSAANGLSLRDKRRIWRHAGAP